MASAVAIFVLCIVCVAVDSFPWVNRFDQVAEFACAGNQMLSFLGSQYSTHHHDRRWRYACNQAPAAVTDCNWTPVLDFINNFDENFEFACPGNKVLNGMLSRHRNTYEDRRFKMMCCTVQQKTPTNCVTTDFINNWHMEMNYFVPQNKYIRGVVSYHDDEFQDRVWRLVICDLE